MKTIKLGVIGISTLLLAACATTNPYTGEQQTSKAVGGAAIGAIGGAIIGAATSSDRGKGALIGAAGGAAVGGGIGYYMDVQEAELRKQLASTGVSVTRSGDQIVLNMPNAITFDVNESNLKPEAKNALNSVLLVLKEYDKTRVNILGHTDSSGSASYNQLLSEKRATAVADHLLKNKLPYSRVKTRGLGETQPIASNSNQSGREQNRRVELILTPLQA